MFCACRVQVGIIRGVEVDIESNLEKQKAERKQQSLQLRKWTDQAQKHAQQLAERDGEALWPPRAALEVADRMLLLLKATAGKASCRWRAIHASTAVPRVLLTAYGGGAVAEREQVYVPCRYCRGSASTHPSRGAREHGGEGEAGVAGERQLRGTAHACLALKLELAFG